MKTLLILAAVLVASCSARLKCVPSDVTPPPITPPPDTPPPDTTTTPPPDTTTTTCIPYTTTTPPPDTTTTPPPKHLKECKNCSPGTYTGSGLNQSYDPCDRCTNGPSSNYKYTITVNGTTLGCCQSNDPFLSQNSYDYGDKNHSKGSYSR